ncbi:GAF domain-containing protein [Rhodococcoides kroppenstedtii]|uniref:GAF domain-containing protein n=1 Tax=Rhodococcoides kroppenstedtii TaxID=293050 RepID=A0A1I0T1X2_9NOCA|nr:GAF and ANTAR domain-containing protein [Rhodococcus kroppenstedtii]SFA45026.1 GAF domain-containing protein [Rhodococcus kroppenstedtii]
MTTRDGYAVADLRIAAVVRDIARLGDGDDHLAELLDRSARDIRISIAGAAHCGITIAVDGATFTAAASDPAVEPITTEQFTVGHGPCLHAAKTGHGVEADCHEVDPRWPRFGAAARAVGVRSMLCAPVRVDDAAVGSLTLFFRDTDLLTATDEQALELLADAVGDALSRHRRLRTLEATIAGLREAIDHRAPIEQAKGILMALHSIDADAAFAALSTESQRTNRKLRTVAAEFVHAVSTAAPIPGLLADAPADPLHR